MSWIDDAHRFWREAFARMRFVRKVFWEGYMTYIRELATSRQCKGTAYAPSFLMSEAAWTGCGKGMKIKVSGGMPCIVLTKHHEWKFITGSLIVGSAGLVRKFPRLLYSRHLCVVMAPKGTRLPSQLQIRPSLSGDTSTSPS